MVDYMPLGSIVLFKGGIQKVIIVSRGIVVRNDESGKEFFFDYGAVPYPQGLISEHMLYFNHENISKVVFEGYRDIESDNVSDNINRFLEAHPDIEKGNPQKWNA